MEELVKSGPDRDSPPTLAAHDTDKRLMICPVALPPK